MRPYNNTLQPNLTETFLGIIWKIQLHPSGIIAIETRDADLKQVHFSVFNFITGETLFKEHIYEESWNLSLAFTGRKNLVLNAYEHSETPETKGILSINIDDGSVIWQQYNISLNQVNDAGLQVYDSRFLPRKYYWIDHLTAEIISQPDAGSAQMGIIFPTIEPKFVFPLFINHGKIAGDLSALRYSDMVFLSFHELDGNYFKQRMIVYQGDKVLIDDILISGIQKLQPEAFFIQQNRLFYIRNKKKIVTYLV